MANRIAPTLFQLGLLSIGVLILLAVGSDDAGVISFRGHPSWAMATSSSAIVSPMNPNPANLYVIYNNFGKVTRPYEDLVAWDVAGPDSGIAEQWVAMPFTPTQNAEVDLIAVAIEHHTGSPNSFVLSLNADSGGLPGTPIQTWSVNNSPQYGTCCVVDVVKGTGGIRVAKGVQYWVVASTDQNDQATRMEWDLSPRQIEAPFAFGGPHGWSEFVAFLSAFGVFGKSLD